MWQVTTPTSYETESEWCPSTSTPLNHGLDCGCRHTGTKEDPEPVDSDSDSDSAHSSPFQPSPVSTTQSLEMTQYNQSVQDAVVVFQQAAYSSGSTNTLAQEVLSNALQISADLDANVCDTPTSNVGFSTPLSYPTLSTANLLPQTEDEWIVFMTDIDIDTSNVCRKLGF